MNRSIHAVFFLATLVSCSLATAQASHAFLWTASNGMQDLGVVRGWVDSEGYAFDRAGAVVGCDGNDMAEAAFGRTPNGNMRLLNGLSTTNSCAAGINDSGQVVGYSLTEAGVLHAFLWSRDSSAQDLGTLGGQDSVATGINDSGAVVGYSETSDSVIHAFLWTASAGMQDLTMLGGKPCPACKSYAHAISNDGTIVGEASASKNARDYPFAWRNGTFRMLGDLGGVGGKGGGAALGVNKFGQVVGEALTASGDTHAFLWTKSGGMQDLGTLAGFTTSIAQGISKSGQVVGWCETATGVVRAFIWSNEGGMADLGTLGGPGATASAINDAGEVTGAADTQ